MPETMSSAKNKISIRRRKTFETKICEEVSPPQQRKPDDARRADQVFQSDELIFKNLCGFAMEIAHAISLAALIHRA
jgi:hypothetical protein